MTREHTPRRTIRVGDSLWAAFLRKHGPRGASARIRAMIAADVQKQNTGEQAREAHSR